MPESEAEVPESAPEVPESEAEVPESEAEVPAHLPSPPHHLHQSVCALDVASDAYSGGKLVEYSIGDFVSLAGLKTEKYNGKSGTVVDFDAPSNRAPIAQKPSTTVTQPSTLRTASCLLRMPRM